ncbi:MAG: GTPase Era [Deltaproteobacteria bacterium]|nr:GTPase Era [Deltaproteobacteria bacterium]
MSEFRCGFVSLIGRPNVGKSTLLNNILEEKIAIVTDKPQTTRNRIVGIKNGPGVQLILVDTPGLHTPRGLLNQALVETSKAAWRDSDLALILLEAATGRLRKGERAIVSQALAEEVPFLVALNKIDLLAERDGDSLRNLPMFVELVGEFGVAPEKIFFLCAQDGVGVAALTQRMQDLLPLHPAYFPDDVQTEISERFWVQEVIREQVFKLTRDEIPYAIAVEIDYYRDLDERLSIGATIHVEQNSQKGIIIGRKGSMLKDIGIKSRLAIEAFVGIPVYLELHVAVAKNWTRDAAQLQRFGYDKR